MADNFSSDLRTAARMLANRPGFASVAVLTLALGIGANTAIFSVVYAVLLRPLPYGDADRLVRAVNVVPDADLELTSGADYIAWRDQSRQLAAVAAFDTSMVTLHTEAEPENVQAARVSASFLPVLGVTPAQGRGFISQEERLNGGPAAIVTDRFWTRMFGEQARLDGQRIRLDQGDFPIVGVLPAGFRVPRESAVEILLPLALDEAIELGRQEMTLVTVLGRLEPEVTLAQAHAELAAIRQRAEAETRMAAQGPSGPAPGGSTGRRVRVLAGSAAPGTAGAGRSGVPPSEAAPPGAATRRVVRVAAGEAGRSPGAPGPAPAGAPQTGTPAPGAAVPQAAEPVPGGGARRVVRMAGEPGRPPGPPGAGPGGVPRIGEPAPGAAAPQAAEPAQGGGARRMVRVMAGGPGGPGAGPPPRMPATVLQVTPLREWLVGDVRLDLLVLLGAVGCVLLIACANIANLLLARATARRQEIGIRAALGARRWHLARLLLTESVVLGLLGGACGLLLAAAAVRPLVAMIPPELGEGLFHHLEIGLNLPVLAFTFGLAVATGLLFGLAPSLVASRPNLQEPLKEGARSGGRSGLLRGMVVAAEVAVAVVLLVGAGLLLRSFLRLQAVDLGFDPERVLTVRVNLAPARYPSPASRTAFFEELARRVRALPGVRSVSFADSLPPQGFTRIVRGINAEGKPPFDVGEAPEIGIAGVGPDYFQTLGIRLLRGRALLESDAEGAQPVVVVSEGMARRLWGTEDPVGRRLTSRIPGEAGPLVVGLVADVKQDGLEAASQRLQMYMPFVQQPMPFGSLAVLTRGDPAALAPALRREIQDLDRNLPVLELETLEHKLADSLAGRRFNLLLLGTFALLALVLAAIGLYGVLSYAVAQRTQEIGIRLALGAQRDGVRRLVLRQGLALTAAGAVVGLILAYLIGGVLRSSLFGVTVADPVTFLCIPLLLMAVACLAAWFPAWRATRVEPVIALRGEA